MVGKAENYSSNVRHWFHGIQGTNNEYVVEYSIDAVPISKEKVPKCRKPGQTRGRKKKRTAKKNRKSPNNIRRFLSKIFKF